MEPELYGLGIEGVSFHSSRLATTERSEMPAAGISIAAVYPEMGVDAVVYACAETSFLDGVNANAVIIDAIIQRTQLPAVTATWAMVLALRNIWAERIALVTPYTHERGEIMEQFLQRCGISVVRAVHRDFNADKADSREWYPTNAQPPTTAYRLARQVAREGGIDAVLISATNFRTFEMLESATSDCGVPVVSCNQSILWWLAVTLDLGTLPVTAGIAGKPS